MKNYIYKIQWLFMVTESYFTSKTQLRRELYTVIRSLGARSLDKIYFRDSDLNIVDTYTSMQNYGFGTANFETIKYIKKQLKNNDKIYSIELLRR